jgi:RNA polymerase sigma factor (sigma-70 family)
VRQALEGSPPDIVESTLAEAEPELRALLWRFRVPPDDAQDLLQDTILAFLLRRERVLSPTPWLLTTLKNRCLQYWRKRRRSLLVAVDSALLDDLGPSRAPEQERSDLRRDLSGALDRLTPRCRQILRLRYGFEYTGPEIADRLGAKAPAIRQATLRCLSALSRRLTAPEPSGDPECAP